MQSIIYSLRRTLSFQNFQLFTIFANIFLGFGLGKILMTPGTELGASLLIKVLLTIGTCLFANYLIYLHRTAKGIIRTAKGKLRPALREGLLCAALNGVVFFLSFALFFIKAHVA